MSEADTAFAEIQDGMAAIGTAVKFTCDGAAYSGVLGSTDLTTQMLTGGYNERSQILIRATKGQFGAPPVQHGPIVITAPSPYSGMQWARKEVSIDEVAHYVFTLMRQVQP